MVKLNKYTLEVLNSVCKYQQKQNILDSESQITNSIFVLLGEKSGADIVRTDTTKNIQITTNYTIQIPETILPYKTNTVKKQEYMYHTIQKLEEINNNIQTKNQDNVLLLYNKNTTTTEQVNEVLSTPVSKQNHMLVGEFYGYPESSTLFFARNIMKEKSNVHIILSYLEKHNMYSSVKQDYMKATNLTNYVPQPSKENIEQIIKNNIHRKQLLQQIKTDINKQNYSFLYTHLSEQIQQTKPTQIYK